MKYITVATIVFMLLGQAQARHIPSPKAPLKAICKLPDGTENIFHTRTIYYNSETGKAAGIGFGPNRQDDGIKVLSGDCIIEPTTENQSYRAE